MLRIRGGFSAIQGSWFHIDIAKHLARKTCYFIRNDLVPLFGEDFPSTCLTPEQAGFGDFSLSEIKSKRIPATEKNLHEIK